ncbi:MAG TPA: nicotinate-nucleotide adenylyltransferase [Pseudomonadales bacterium]|nr:nicotinate-nucleotide adenylyltransferase [Pseudomonadales bacterium]
MSTRRLVVCFGGTFDPVHLGHVDAMDDILAKTACDELRLIPCRVSPHKTRPSATSEQRCAMLELASTGRARVCVDRREVARPGPSFTVDTLAGLRAELGPEVALAWVIGMDALGALDRWSRWEALPGLAHLLVLDRPGADLPAAGPVADLLAARRLASAAALRDAAAGGVWFAHQRPRAVSATELRRRLAAGEDTGGLLPAEVWAYISSHGLYGVVQV